MTGFVFQKEIVHSKTKYKLQSALSQIEWSREWTWRCILGGATWQRECIPQYSRRKNGNREVPHSEVGVNRSCGSCWHRANWNYQNKILSVGLVSGLSKKTERQTQNFELITCCLQLFKRISIKNMFSSIFRTRPIWKYSEDSKEIQPWV